MPALVPAFTEGDVARALSCVARHVGDVDASIRDLKADGLIVTRDQLLDWRDRTHSPQYVAISEEMGRATEAATITLARENALRAEHAKRIALDVVSTKLDKDADRITVSDASRALEAIAKTGAMTSSEALALQGRPTDGKSAEDPATLLKGLERLGLKLVAPGQPAPAIDATAEEDPDGS